jgi:PAS domain S-box-containing protein
VKRPHTADELLLDKAGIDFKQVCHHAPVGLALLQWHSVSRSVSVIAANTSFLQILQCDDEELSKSTLEEAMPPLHYDMLRSAINAVLAGEHVVRQELQFITKSAKIAACQIGLSRLPAAEQMSLFVLSADDITGRKVAEQRRLAEFGIEQREDFIATLTHDLKTPIVGANMVLSALLDGSLGPLQVQQSEIISKLKGSNQALLKMIHNLLDIYRYESGPDSLFFENADLSLLIKFCTDEIQPLLDSKRLSIDVSVPKPLPIVCDEQAIQRVLTNLLSNAVKFTPEGGRLTIKAEEAPNTVRICLQDTGSGISAKDLERLFQRFWQGEPGKRYAAGTGLGLYFCNSVIRAHGGNIECQSSLGEGTTFKITLPAKQSGQRISP